MYRRIVIGYDGSDPAIEALAEREVDPLVVGSRGYGPLRTVLLGRVSGPLIRSAPSPVLVLPRGAEATDRPAASAAVE